MAEGLTQGVSWPPARRIFGTKPSKGLNGYPCESRRRYETASTVLTSNKGFEEWSEIFGDQVTGACARVISESCGSAG